MRGYFTATLRAPSLVAPLRFINELGHGFLESVYENALMIVLDSSGFSVESQKAIKCEISRQISRRLLR